MDVDVFGLGKHQDARRAGVDAPLTLGDRNPLDAVDATFVLQVGPHSITWCDGTLRLDRHRDVLVAAEVGLLRVENLRLPALPLSETQIHAQQVTGVHADRELPVVWAVARGSLVNKAILVPAALLISWAAPWLITPLLMLGGAYLCFEGFEKLAHRFLHSRAEVEAEHRKTLQALADPAVDLVAYERDKIKGAVRTDFILSAEIIVITLGTVAAASFGQQLTVLASIAVLMTVGVYGLVAGIVKLDDAGLYLSRHALGFVRAAGRGILAAAVLAWARAVSEFGAIVLLTYNPQVASVLIYDRFTTVGLPAAIPAALLLLAVALGVFALVRVLQPTEHR